MIQTYFLRVDSDEIVSSEVNAGINSSYVISLAHGSCLTPQKDMISVRHEECFV